MIPMSFRSKHNGTRAFTLIECVVAISILCLLIAITIPAVQMAREAARRINCQSNLRQIGIGVANYASSYGRLPSAMGGGGYSFLVSILPYMDQSSLFNSINFAFSVDNSGAANLTASGLANSVLLCPSDADDSVVQGQAWTSYAGCRGIGIQKYGENGLFQFPPGVSTSYQEISDGTSMTAMTSEWVLGSGPIGDRNPRRTIFQTDSRRSKPDQFDDFGNLCHNLDVNKARVSAHRKGLNWMHGEFGKTLYNHTMTLNDHTCLNGTGYQVGAWTSSSQHPGGANLLLADGNVRYISESIDLQVWRAIGSRNGGEIVSSDSF